MPPHFVVGLLIISLFMMRCWTTHVLFLCYWYWISWEIMVLLDGERSKCNMLYFNDHLSWNKGKCRSSVQAWDTFFRFRCCCIIRLYGAAWCCRLLGILQGSRVSTWLWGCFDGTARRWSTVKFWTYAWTSIACFDLISLCHVV